MAPVLGPTREQVVARLRNATPDHFSPITLAPNGAPLATIRRESDGRWVVRALKKDRLASQAAYEKARASGRRWSPEMEWQFLKPDEELLAAERADALADKLATWNRDLFRSA